MNDFRRLLWCDCRGLFPGCHHENTFRDRWPTLGTGSPRFPKQTVERDRMSSVEMERKSDAQKGNVNNGRFPHPRDGCTHNGAFHSMPTSRYSDCQGEQKKPLLLITERWNFRLRLLRPPRRKKVSSSGCEIFFSNHPWTGRVKYWR